MSIYSLLDFYADWCGNCRVLKPIIESLDIETEIIDCANDLLIAREFNISELPTLVLLKDGVEVARLVKPSPNKDFIVNWIKENE